MKRAIIFIITLVISLSCCVPAFASSGTFVGDDIIKSDLQANEQEILDYFTDNTDILEYVYGNQVKSLHSGEIDYDNSFVVFYEFNPLKLLNLKKSDMEKFVNNADYYSYLRVCKNSKYSSTSYFKLFRIKPMDEDLKKKSTQKQIEEWEQKVGKLSVTGVSDTLNAKKGFDFDYKKILLEYLNERGISEPTVYFIDTYSDEMPFYAICFDGDSKPIIVGFDYEYTMTGSKQNIKSVTPREYTYKEIKKLPHKSEYKVVGETELVLIRIGTVLLYITPVAIITAIIIIIKKRKKNKT